MSSPPQPPRRHSAPEADSNAVPGAMSDALLDLVEEDVEGGRYLQAWQRFSAAFEPARDRGEWRVCEIGCQIASQIDLPVRARLFQRELWRRHRDDPRVWTSQLWELNELRHRFDAWEFALRADRPVATDRRDTADWHLAVTGAYTALRDFENARRELEFAAEHGGRSAAWLHEAAELAEEQDDLPRALELVREGLAKEGADRHPLLLAEECWLLHESGQTDAALAAYRAARSTIESARLEAGYARLLFEAGDLVAARSVLEQCLDAYPLERGTRRRHHSMLVRICRALGDDPATLRHAEAMGPRGEEWADSIRTFLDEAPLQSGGEQEQEPKPGRVLLPVPFVRQDRNHCAPATMAVLLAYHGEEVDHREIADAISYDGTTDHAALRWAEEQGLRIWVFRFDAEVARRLVDLDLPFGLMTRYVRSGHIQAVMGYDRVLDTFLIREPGWHAAEEVAAEKITTQQAARGGDCILLLPARLEHLVPVDILPDAEAGLELVRLRGDLAARRVHAAEERFARLRALPSCGMRFEAEEAMAVEVGDRHWELRIARARWEAHPEDARCRLLYAEALRRRGDWQQVRDFLETCRDRSADLDLLFGDVIRCHAGERRRAEALTRSAIRRLGGRGHALRDLADILWHEPAERERALAIYRLASCGDPRNEWLADAYFDACHRLLANEAGLAFLRRRWEAWQDKSPGPACTFARALEECHQRPEAVAVLRAAVERHPEDPDARQKLFGLLLADQQYAAAELLLDAGQHGFPANAWHLARLRLARARGDWQAAGAALIEAARTAPTEPSVQKRYLRYLVDEHGREASLAACEELVREHGDDSSLMVEVVDIFDSCDQRDRAEELLRRLVAAHPGEGWLRAKLARHLLTSGRNEAARELCEALVEETPDSSAVWIDACDVRAALGDPEGAHRAARKALELSPNRSGALYRLLQLAESPEQAAAELRYAMTLIRRQPPEQYALSSFVERAEDVLPREEVEGFLDALRGDFPSTPAIGIATCRFLSVHDDEASALALTEDLLRQFPWDVEIWLLRAASLRKLGRLEEERAVLGEFLEREPACASALEEMGESFELSGRPADARRSFERGLTLAPHTPVLHIFLAESLWRAGEREQALEAMARAGVLDRRVWWAFTARVRWLLELDRTAEALAVAEEFVRANPIRAEAYRLLAEAVEALGRHEERLTALRRAVELDPRIGRTRDILVRALAESRRFDEARAVVAEGTRLLGETPALGVRAAWVERQAGDYRGSRAALEALLAAHPDFESGWIRLLGWYEEEGCGDQILALYLDPPEGLRDSHQRCRYAADVYLARGEKAAAETALRRALDLDPSYSWARTRLCGLLLDRGKSERAVKLLEGMTEPATTDYPSAALVVRASAATGDLDRARAFFLRLLRDEYPEADELVAADKALRAKDAAGHEAWLQQQRDADQSHAVLRSLAMLHARRGGGEESAFFAALGQLNAVLPEESRERTVAELCCEAGDLVSNQRLADWIRGNVSRSLASAEDWGRICNALCCREGAATLVWFAGDAYKRPDARGWMLANVAEGFLRVGRLDDMKAVAEHALGSLPADHSVWWHRRFLALHAYRSGEYQHCQELAAIPIDRDPITQLDLAVLMTLARLRLAKGRSRRVTMLAHRMPGLIERRERALAEAKGVVDDTDLMPREFLSAVLSRDSLLMQFGRIGWWLLRLWHVTLPKTFRIFGGPPSGSGVARARISLRRRDRSGG